MAKAKRLAQRIRCAIYTRKSSDEGREQEFNSLHAQREACEAFIASQRHEGWHALSAHYDDGGYSGGTMDRPALTRLTDDIAGGKIDTVVVYKIDRLTRSLFDFAKIVEIFDAKDVSFVSVTQAFNTTTSMGRLTLNVLLSFAQFEREVTSERIRDKIAASKKKGMWMGGAVPLGYDAVDRKLKINAREAQTVRRLLELYLKLGSVRKLQQETRRLGLKTKIRTLADGRRLGDTDFSRGHLYRILSSPIYIGRIPHRQTSYDGEHDAIVAVETWNKVQALLATNAGRQRGRTSSKHPSLLAGFLFTEQGVPFTPSHAVNHGRRYRYYVERSLVTPSARAAKKTDNPLNTNGGTGPRSKGWRLPAHEIERLVLKQVALYLRDRSALLDTLRVKHKSPDAVSGVLAHASKIVEVCETASPKIQADIVAALVRRVTVAPDKVTIEIARKALTARLLDQEAQDASASIRSDTVAIDVPVCLRRRGVEAKLIVPDLMDSVSDPDPSLVKLLVRAHEWFGRLLRGEAKDVQAIATAEKLDRSYVARVVSLAFLSPTTTKVILAGRQPPELTAKQLLRSANNIPIAWADESLFGTAK
ncbi:recombinase family protein [Methyloceanibacter sp.]|uniref:recombinase family protein n=1 Tax=Methyloceanibacter sp. TaxID=1965321 RepID=UPI002CC1B559|nr:recombinase family protein [Methyloceanibacter sp.]HML90854.1 recombinase family protein [Methyloceanibacter sp.]